MTTGPDPLPVFGGATTPAVGWLIGRLLEPSQEGGLVLAQAANKGSSKTTNLFILYFKTGKTVATFYHKTIMQIIMLWSMMAVFFDLVLTPIAVIGAWTSGGVLEATTGGLKALAASAVTRSD